MMLMLCVSATGICINALAKMDFKATGITARVRIEDFKSLQFLCFDYGRSNFIMHTSLSSFVFCQNMYFVCV